VVYRTQLTKSPLTWELPAIST